jgi:hypothetical protein
MYVCVVLVGGLGWVGFLFRFEESPSDSSPSILVAPRFLFFVSKNKNNGPDLYAAHSRQRVAE